MIKPQQALNITCMCMLFLSVLASSCKKTETVPYDQKAANRMVEYKVTNAAEDLYGIIDNTDNSITVYIPYYISVNVIVPTITLEEGAALIDNGGNEIDLLEDLEPVLVETEGYTYTVKDSEGAERTYTLNIQIVPFYEPLETGYKLVWDANNIAKADTVSATEVLVNSRFIIYGNFESSSNNGKLTLIDNETGEAVPNGLSLVSVDRSRDFHYMTAGVSAEVDSGYYHVQVEHQGRRDTLPTIHLVYKKPFFDYLSSSCAIGDTVTLKVRGSNTTDNYSGVNTGVSGVYFKFSSIHPPGFQSTQGLAEFPAALYNKRIDVEILEQDRTSIKFKLPDIPVGFYSNWISAGSGIDGFSLGESSLMIYVDFASPEWGNDNLLSIAPPTFEVKPKSN